MPFPFTCPSCRHTSQLPEDLAGGQAKCPVCGLIVGLPTSISAHTAIRKSVPVVSGVDEEIPVVAPARTTKPATILLVVVLAVGGLTVLSCCGGGLIVADWLIGGSNVESNTAHVVVLDDSPSLPSPPAVSKREISLAPDDDRQSPKYWVQRLRDGDAEQVAAARERLLNIGAKAVPDLRGASRGKDMKLRLAAVRLLGEIGEDAVEAWNDIAANLESSDPNLRLSSAEALGKLGTQAYPCLPRLLRAAGDADPKVRSAVFDSLEKVGSPAREDIPKLLVLWNEPDAPKRVILVSAVRKLTLDPGATAILFVPLLHDQAKPIRLTAIEALGEAGPTARAKTYSKLLPMLDDPDADIRTQALTSIRKLGAATPADRPQLETGLRGRSVEIRIYCLESLGGIAPEARPSIPLIARRTSDSEIAVRLAAIKALGRFGKAALDVADELLIALRDSEASVRIEAINSLTPISRENGLMAALFDSLGDSSRDVSQAAAIAIRAARPPLSKSDLSLLARYLRKSNPAVRRFCAEELARIGPAVEPILTDLLAAAGDSDPVVCGHLYSALGTLGPKAAQAAPLLIEKLNGILKNEGEESGSSEQFRSGLIALEKIAKIEQAGPIINAGFKARSKQLRKATIQALSQSNEAAQKAAPALCASLGDPDLGELAAETILRVRGRDMVAALANVVDKGPAPARLRAIKLLEAMGPEAKPALGALDRAMRYFPKKEDGKAAREAIRAINKK